MNHEIDFYMPPSPKIIFFFRLNINPTTIKKNIFVNRTSKKKKKSSTHLRTSTSNDYIFFSLCSGE